MSQCTDAQSRELCTKLQTHIEILEYAIVRMSSKAELHGAAQQVCLLVTSLALIVFILKKYHGNS